MLKKILSLFALTGETPQPDRIPLAAAVLLLEIAYADGELSAEEERIIVQVLKERFDLGSDLQAELLTLAAETRAQSVDLHQFTSQINSNFSQLEKEQIIAAFWQLAYADGRLDVHEETALRQLAGLIGLSHRQLIDAKLKVRDTLQE
jgi:uncharacterized tellurite resistance protein B-like protein